MPRTTHYALRLPVNERPTFDTQLAIFLRKHDMTVYALAQTIGADPKSVAAWRDNRQFPSLIAAYKVEHATKGEVPASSWLGTELGKHLWDAFGLDWKKWRQAKERSRVRLLKGRRRGR